MNPIEQFRAWFTEALASSSMREPTYVVLSTLSQSGHPSSRVVLLKDLTSEGGFVFYTNFNSQKGQELSNNPKCSLLFYWDELYRQVRVKGEATPIDDDDADRYFASRARASQIGAWASLQSSTLEDRETLEARVAHFEKEFANKDVPRPEHWSGFVVAATQIEFWQGQDHRLHDRTRYSRAQGAWEFERLYP